MRIQLVWEDQKASMPKLRRWAREIKREVGLDLKPEIYHTYCYLGCDVPGFTDARTPYADAYRLPWREFDKVEAFLQKRKVFCSLAVNTSFGPLEFIDALLRHRRADRQVMATVAQILKTTRRSNPDRLLQQARVTLESALEGRPL